MFAEVFTAKSTRSKRWLGVLGRQKIRETITAPGDLSPNIYSGTFKSFATVIPIVLPKSSQAILHVAQKTSQKSVCKCWKTHPTGFSIKHYGEFGLRRIANA
jgi:hypothetical protein